MLGLFGVFYAVNVALTFVNRSYNLSKDQGFKSEEGKNAVFAICYGGKEQDDAAHASPLVTPTPQVAYLMQNPTYYEISFNNLNF